MLMAKVQADAGRRSWVVAFKRRADALTAALDEAGVAYRTCDAWRRYGLLITQPGGRLADPLVPRRKPARTEG